MLDCRDIEAWLGPLREERWSYPQRGGTEGRGYSGEVHCVCIGSFTTCGCEKEGGYDVKDGK